MTPPKSTSSVYYDDVHSRKDRPECYRLVKKRGYRTYLYASRMSEIQERGRPIWGFCQMPFFKSRGGGVALGPEEEGAGSMTA